ncbi:MAG TPA: beta-propeller fold lactonase family protein [Gemmatimonadota bacterium]|jgi:YVTN family beta-propeller protein
MNRTTLRLLTHPLSLLALAAAFGAACGRKAGEEAPPAPADTSMATISEAPAPTAGRRPLIYVTNEDSDDVTVIDAATDSVIATIPVGKRPRGIQVSPDGSTIYVAVSGSPKAGPGVDESTLPPPDKSADGIVVMDAATHQVKEKLPGGSDPEQFGVLPDGSRVYVSNEDNATATVLDVQSGEVLATVPVGVEPEGVAISPDGKHVYVSAETDHDVTVIDAATNKPIASFQVGERPRAIAFHPGQPLAYVTSELGGTVSVVSTDDYKVQDTIKLQGKNVKPMGVVVAPDGSRVYVATGRGGTVAVIDAATNKVLRTIPVGERPWGIGITPDGKKLYTANGPGNDVSVVDLATGQVTKRLPAGKGPWGVAVAE